MSANVFNPKFQHLKGKDAWNKNLQQVTLVAQRLYSSLGPNGAYKMVTYNKGPEKVVKITKDAVAVLEEYAIQYPTVAVLAEAAKMQREQVGDGVTSAVILISALLKNADKLKRQRVHPITILNGYQAAGKKAVQIINSNSKPCGDNRLDAVVGMLDCGRGCLTKELYGMLTDAAETCSDNGKVDKTRTRIIRKPGGDIWQTKAIKGLAVKKCKCHPNMPSTVKEPIIAVTSERIGINRLEIKMPGQGPFHMKLDFDTPDKRYGCKAVEEQQKSQTLKKLQALGTNVLFSQQPIDDYSKSKLLGMGVLAFESVDRADLELICKATSTKMVGNLADLTSSDLGKAEGLETEKIGLETLTTLSGCDFTTFIVRGSTVQALDELELLISNYLSLLASAEKSGGLVSAGGAIEMQVARELQGYALEFGGREQLAVEGFADALFDVPRCLAANCGLNADDALAQWRKLQNDGFLDYGLAADGSFGKIGLELSEVKVSIITRAFEVATLLLRIDEQIAYKEIVKFHKK